ncbi:MAG: endonuclease III [Chloroflexota bacterium]|nr:endonuclease III [Chloroflexota bacterium]
MNDRTAQALTIHRLLIEQYGDHPWHPQRDPLSELIVTILSQNTNDVNRDRAWQRLRERFSASGSRDTVDWMEVMTAPTEELVEAIRPGGLANTKAPRIQEALRTILAERSELSLDFLAQMSVGEARAWLMRLKGVGPKTAAIVLLFSLGQPAFPVDTHIHRLSRRLGLIPANTSREKAHRLLEELLPSEIYYPFHLNLIAHGREVCRARAPRCALCVLREHCDYYK